MPATLLHAPLACSLAARFAAAEGGVEIDLRIANMATKDLTGGGSLYDANPLGQVSVLQLPNGEVLTETSVVLAWLQAQSANDEFRVDSTASSYFQLLRWLGFCATELHKQIFRVVFYPEATDAVKDKVRALAPQRFKLLDARLERHDYLLGERFSAADCYLGWFFVLADRAQVEPSDFPNLQRYRDRVLARPKIAALIADDREKQKALGR